MFSLVYNGLLLIVFFFTLPWWLWEMVWHRKHRHSFLQKLGFKLPQFPAPSKAPRVWVHATSVGEVKAVAPLIAHMQKERPHALFFVSTTTEAGQEEAKRLSQIENCFYLPFDFSWVVRRLIRALHPTILILVEGDLWLNLIQAAPHAVVVNGKMSEKSFSRFQKLPFFTKKLLGKIDRLCVQNGVFAERFQQLGVDPLRITITGNLKFDQPFPQIDAEAWKKRLGIQATDRVITLASTHPPEEEKIIQILHPLMQRFKTLKILIAPRHPHRFDSVAELLKRKGLEISRFSEGPLLPTHQLILIDTMGILTACYHLSEIAIVGGSFVPGIGGHNIFEPAALGVPVIFGPYMDSQTDLVKLVLDEGAGAQVSLENLAETLEKLLTSPSLSMRQAGLRLKRQVHGSTLRTWNQIKKFI